MIMCVGVSYHIPLISLLYIHYYPKKNSMSMIMTHIPMAAQSHVAAQFHRQVACDAA